MRKEKPTSKIGPSLENTWEEWLAVVVAAEKFDNFLGFYYKRQWNWLLIVLANELTDTESRDQSYQWENNWKTKQKRAIYSTIMIITIDEERKKNSSSKGVSNSEARSYGREKEKNKKKKEKEKNVESYDEYMCVYRDRAQHNEK